MRWLHTALSSLWPSDAGGLASALGDRTSAGIVLGPVGQVGMERGNPNDSGRTVFQNMDEYHDSNGWTQWNDLRLSKDRDLEYRLNVDGPDAGSTVLQ